MPATSGAFAAFNSSVYYSATAIDDKSEANIVAALIAANLVSGIQEIGDITAEGANIEYAEYGAEYSSSIPGQKSPGTFDMTITMDFSNAIHTGFRDDNGKILHTFIVVFEESDANATYCAFDGQVLSSTVTLGVDAVTTLTMSLSRQGAPTWIDKT